MTLPTAPAVTRALQPAARPTGAAALRPTAGPAARPASEPAVAAVAKRVLTGDRPTGPLHLGHYFGTLANRVALQQQGHDLFVVVADYQVVTDRDRPGDLTSLVCEMVLDYLGCGLDPERTTIFPHSAVAELNQLMLPLLSLVTTGELDRNPTVKQEIALSGRRTVSGLMLSYPVHQAADILFCHGELVPVGLDQLPHVELARTLARRFNDRYRPVFTVPEALVGEAPVLAGLDGRKMSKSLGNAIALTDSDDTVEAKIRRARTDSERVIRFDPDGRPQVANLLRLGAHCSGRTPQDLADEAGTGGAAALKALVTEAVIGRLEPIRRRRRAFHAGDALDVLAAGTERARKIAAGTLEEVRDAMGMRYAGLYRGPLR
jgi:tryptophanyl-tRNA synthetase